MLVLKLAIKFLAPNARPASTALVSLLALLRLDQNAQLDTSAPWELELPFLASLAPTDQLPEPQSTLNVTRVIPPLILLKLASLVDL